MDSTVRTSDQLRRAYEMNPGEVYDLLVENEMLKESLRHVHAELSKQDRTVFRVITGSGTSLRPAFVEAKAMTLISDQAIDQGPAEIIAYHAKQSMARIEALAKAEGRQPLDFTWRFSLGRDYAK